MAASFEDPGPAVDDVESFSSSRRKVKCGCGAVFGPNTPWMKTKVARGGIVQPNHPQCKQCGDDNRENHAYLAVSEYHQHMGTATGQRGKTQCIEASKNPGAEKPFFEAALKESKTIRSYVEESHIIANEKELEKSTELKSKVATPKRCARMQLQADLDTWEGDITGSEGDVELDGADAAEMHSDSGVAIDADPDAEMRALDEALDEESPLEAAPRTASDTCE